MNGNTPMSVTTSSFSRASERSSSGSADESCTVHPWSCGQRSKMTSRRAARSSSSGGRSADRASSWAGFMRPYPQAPCPGGNSVQIPDEGLAAQELLRFRPGGHRAHDRGGDQVVHLVVWRLAEPRRERDFEDEELALEPRRIDVIGQARAIAHAEAEQLRTAHEDRLDPFQDPSFDRADEFLPASSACLFGLPLCSPRTTILPAWSTATPFWFK